jgi:hypothetical protein
MGNDSRIQKKVMNILSDILREYNFVEIDESVIYSLKSWGYDYISSGITKYFELPYFHVHLSMTKRISVIEQFWEEYADEIHLSYMGKHKIPSLSVSIQYAYPNIVNEPFYNADDSRGIFKFNNDKSGYQEFEEVAKYLIIKKLIPKSVELNDLKVLDNMINYKIELDEKPRDSYIFIFQGLIFRRIILAKLVGNPLYEDICNYHRKSIPNWLEASKHRGYEYYKNYPVVLEKVIENLKNVRPLANTIIS